MGAFKHIKQIFKKFDYFGVHFNFFYKAKPKYHSFTGGIIFLSFLILTITYIGINVGPFINRRNISIMNYESSLAKTDKISFQNYSSTVAVGLSCDALKNKSDIYKFLSVEINFVTFIKNEGASYKEKIPIELERCHHGSFYNHFNESFDELGIGDYFCPKNISHEIYGIYSDQIFKYYEYTIRAKAGVDQNEILEKLISSECQLGFYFIDVGIDIDNFKSPEQFFLNNKFIVLKADEIIKMNLFFKIHSFSSYENYLFDNYWTKFFLGYSDLQYYTVYKGMSRFDKKPNDYDIFSKVYLRADIKRTIIERKYMKFTEFAANMSSIFSHLFFFLFISVGFINSFYAYHSVMKKIFEFKETYRTIERSEAFKNKPVSSKMSSYPKKNSNKKKYQTEMDQKKVLLNVKNCSFKLKKLNEIIDNKNKTFYSSSILSEGECLNDASLKRENDIHEYHLGRKLKIFKKSILFPQVMSKQFKNNLIPFKYSIVELVFIFLLPCFQWKSLKKKNILLEKAKIKLYFQLDILTYLKNMQLLDLLNYVLLEKNENVILHFLSKPAISFANRDDIYDKLHNVNNINKNEIDDFYSSVQTLLNKTDKTSIEKRICHLTNLELKELIGSNQSENIDDKEKLNMKN